MLRGRGVLELLAESENTGKERKGSLCNIHYYDDDLRKRIRGLRREESLL